MWSTASSSNPFDERRQPVEQPLLIVLEQPERPLDRGPKGAVPLVEAPTDRAPERHALVERAEHPVHTRATAYGPPPARSRAASRRGGRRGRSMVAALHAAEIGPGGGRPLPEEVDGAGGPVEGVHGHDVLAVDGERLTAGREHVQLRAAAGEGVGHAARLPSTTCSQLSITRSVRWAARSICIAARGVVGAGGPDRDGHARSRHRSSRRRRPAARTTRWRTHPTSSAAACTARRVLPTPPTPVSVTTRWARTVDDEARGGRRRGPTNDDRCRGRLFV